MSRVKKALELRKEQEDAQKKADRLRYELADVITEMNSEEFSEYRNAVIEE